MPSPIRHHNSRSLINRRKLSNLITRRTELCPGATVRVISAATGHKVSADYAVVSHVMPYRQHRSFQPGDEHLAGFNVVDMRLLETGEMVMWELGDLGVEPIGRSPSGRRLYSKRRATCLLYTAILPR